MEPIEAPVKVTSMRVVEGQHTANVPEEEQEEILERFTEAVYEKGAFVQGEEMTLEYRIVLFDPGSQFGRYLIGFGAGEGEIIVETTFRDQAQEMVAKIECSARLTAGTFGGGFRDAYNRVIEEAVTFATNNFLPPQVK
jgi:hypothetical protein